MQPALSGMTSPHFEQRSLNAADFMFTEGLVQEIRKADSFDSLKELLEAFPIGDDDDSGFIAALKSLLDPIERVRNPV